MSNQNVSNADLLKQIQALTAERDALKQQTERKISLKVSTKGAVSLYGMGRFPVTLYGEQWLKVLDMGTTIRQFVTDNRSKLAIKGPLAGQAKAA